MKYEITPEDRQIMENDLATDRTLKHLRNLSFYKFAPGDILIRENIGYDRDGDEKKWHVETGSGDIPHKYVYLFENELGVGYIRRMSVKGTKLVDRAMCVTQFDPDHTRFKLDPEYADHMLLASEDDQFDTASRYNDMKKRREALHRRNKKKRVDLPDEAAVIAWMKTLKVGDQIWWGYSINNIHKEPYVIDQINIHPIGFPSPSAWSSAPQSNLVTHSVDNSTYKSNLYSNSLCRYYVFKERPEFLDEIID